MLQTVAEPIIADHPANASSSPRSSAEPDAPPADPSPAQAPPTDSAGVDPGTVDLTAESPTRPPLPRDADRAAESLRLALAAAETARENRATEVAVLDMRGVASVFDYFVLATGTSRRQLHAISEEIDHRLEDDLGDRRMGIEGYAESRWILLDYGSVVIHLFDDETRGYYALEDLWNDAQRVALPWE